MADGGCRFKIVAFIFDGDGDEMGSGVTVHYTLNCSPAGNATLSASTSEPEVPVYVSATGHCTCTVTAYGENEVDSSTPATTSSFTFVTGAFSDSMTLLDTNGSGSLAVSGTSYSDLAGPTASYNLNGGSHSNSGTPNSGSFTDAPSGAGVSGDFHTYAYKIYDGAGNTASCSGSSSANVKYTETWTPDAFSSSAVPYGFTLSVTVSNWAEADHSNTDGTAQTIAGISPSTTVTATATGSQTSHESPDYVHPDAAVSTTYPVTITTATTNKQVGLYISGTSASTPNTASSSVSGNTRGGSSSSSTLLHTHVNP